jgi:hypothetical protein
VGRACICSSSRTAPRIDPAAHRREAKAAAGSSELAGSVTEPDVAKGIRDFHEANAIPADSFARMVSFAMSLREDINEILFRPTVPGL